MAFPVLIVVGCTLALGLGFHAVLHRPVVTVSKPTAQRSGLIDTATIVVINRSAKRAYCPNVVISALATSGSELETETAQPLNGQVRLDPNGSESYRATFVHLTAVDYRDKLSKLEAFVIHANPCG
jgi:hypothetical protein